MRRVNQHGHQNGKNFNLYLSIIFLLSIISISCSVNKNIIDHNEVEGIKFWYIHKYTEFSHSIKDCADIVYDTLTNKDTIITDRIVIEKYITEINRLKPVKKHINYDLRVASSIKFKDEKRKYIGVCVSLFNGVVLMDNVLMKKDMSIVKLLDEILYNHLTEKDWTLPFMLEDNEE